MLLDRPIKVGIVEESAIISVVTLIPPAVESGLPPTIISMMEIDHELSESEERSIELNPAVLNDVE